LPARNRGKLSNDDNIFASKWHPVFRNAVDDLCHLLSRGYGVNASLQVVGNRYKLNKRQRNAISRIACSKDEIEIRKQKEEQIKALKNKIVEIDGFNLLILVESLLSGAYVFKGRDGLYRDISSVHGSYKRVTKTDEAILIIGDALQDLGVKSAKWYFDQPVSNSGRLKTKLYELSTEHGFNWEVELVFDPDKILIKSQKIIISSDGWILDQAERWFNMGAYIIRNRNDSDHNIIEV